MTPVFTEQLHQPALLFAAFVPCLLVAAAGACLLPRVDAVRDRRQSRESREEANSTQVA